MEHDDTESLDREIARLVRTRRRVYTGALLLAIAALACAWLVRDPGDAYRTYGAPVVALLLGGLTVSLWRRRVPLDRVEWWMLLILAAVPVTRQIWLFSIAGPADDTWLRLLGNNYWGTSAVLVMVCTIAERRRGLRVGAGIVIASLSIALVGAAAGLARGVIDPGRLPYIAGCLLFLTLFLVLMSGATIMRDQWQNALTRAATHSRRALTDTLTGAANRRAAAERLERECAGGRRGDGVVSVILGDLDGFKRVNDTAGHAVGDAVLVDVAVRLQGALRETDMVARWGGEEFLVIAPGTDLEGGRRLAERCRRAIEATPVAGVAITMTFGVAQYTAGDTPETLLARADANLYAGKGADRNRVEAAMDPEGMPGA